MISNSAFTTKVGRSEKPLNYFPSKVEKASQFPPHNKPYVYPLKSHVVDSDWDTTATARESHMRIINTLSVK